jgi:hypothetical protein
MAGLRMPVYQSWSSLNNFRICINNQGEGGPYEEQKVLHYEFAEPAPKHIAEIYTQKLAKISVRGGFLQMSSDTLLGD